MFSFKNLDQDEIKRMTKFAVTGIGNTVVDYVIYSLLAVLLGVNVYLAQFCGYAAGMLNSYLINRSWTFQTKHRFFSLQLVKFVIVNLITLAVSMLMLKILIDFVGFSLLLAKLPTIGVTIVLNFVLSRLWVFRQA